MNPAPGDIWALTVLDGTAPYTFDGHTFRPANDTGTATLHPTSPLITASLRIWPKEPAS